MIENFRLRHFEKIRTNLHGWGMVALADLVVKAISFALLPVYAKLMSPAEYGIYNYLCIISNVACLVFGFGQYASFSRSESESTFRRKQIHESISANLNFGILCWFGSLAVLMVFFRPLVFSGPITAPLLIGLSLLPPIQIILQIVSIDFFLTKRYAMGVTRSITEALLTQIAGVGSILLFRNHASSARFCSLLLSNIILCCCFLPVSRLGNIMFSAFKNKSWRKINWKILGEGTPLSANAMIGLASNNGDRYMLEKFSSRDQLGIYSFAASFTSVLLVGFSSFNNVWLGIFYQESNTTRWRIRATFAIAIIWVLITILVIGGIWLIFPFFTTHLRAYAGAEKFILFLGGAVLFQIEAQLINNFFNLFKMNHLTTPVNAITGVVSLLLGWILIPKYGAYGAAVQAFGTSLIGLLLLFGLLKLSGKFGTIKEN